LFYPLCLLDIRFLKSCISFCAVGAKANVLQSVDFVLWLAALLILLKRGLFFFHLSFHLQSVVSFFRVAHNVLYPQLRLFLIYLACPVDY